MFQSFSIETTATLGSPSEANAAYSSIVQTFEFSIRHLRPHDGDASRTLSELTNGIERNRVVDDVITGRNDDHS